MPSCWKLKTELIKLVDEACCSIHFLNWRRLILRGWRIRIRCCLAFTRIFFRRWMCQRSWSGSFW